MTDSEREGCISITRNCANASRTRDTNLALKKDAGELEKPEGSFLLLPLLFPVRAFSEEHKAVKSPYFILLCLSKAAGLSISSHGLKGPQGCIKIMEFATSFLSS